jgi:hypothetical protein
MMSDFGPYTEKTRSESGNGFFKKRAETAKTA